MVANTWKALDFGLGSTADLIRDTVRAFAAEEIAPRAAGCHQVQGYLFSPPVDGERIDEMLEPGRRLDARGRVARLATA